MKTGWQCPVCGGGVAPGVERCPCVAVGATPRNETSDGWIEWSGGACPVALYTAVDLRFRNADGSGRTEAGKYSWRHYNGPGDIVAYKVLG